MAVFAIYKYDFRLAEEGNLFIKGTTDKLLDKAQELFNGFLTGDKPFPIQMPKRDKTSVRLDNEVTCKRGDVCLLLVCNEKSKKIMEKKDEQEIFYHPGCYVIIDNRKGVANIAIERTPAFDSNPDKVCQLLEKAINDKFLIEEIGLKIEIRSKVREATLWEMVDHQTHDYNDVITKVVFSFPNPKKVAGIDANYKMKKKLAVMASITNALNGVKGSYHVEAEKGETLRLEQTQEDLAQMVHLCSRNVYDISVHFKYYGVYRFGSEEKAQSVIKDEFIENFKMGQLAILDNGEKGFEMEQWLNDVRRITEGFRDAIPAKKTRKRSTKKAV